VDSWNPLDPTFGSDVDTLYSGERARRRKGGRVVRRERDMDQDATLQHMCEWHVVSGLLSNIHINRETLAPTPKVEGESILAACAPKNRDAC
jgi:hypothetical protein